MKELTLLEIEIIGSFINDPSTHDLIVKLQEDDFIDPTCKLLIKTMKSLETKGEDISLFTLGDKSGVNIYDIVKITSTIATTANIESNIKLLKDKSNRRRYINKLQEALKKAQDETVVIEELKNNVLQELQDIKGEVDNQTTTLREAMLETIHELDARYNNRHDTSLYTGIPKLDKYTAGLHPQELTTIGARPGIGKTIIGMQLALKVARSGKKVIYTSLEMDVTQLCERIIAAEAGVDSLRLRTGHIQDSEWQGINSTASRNAIDNFLIDNSSRNPQHIRSKIRAEKPSLYVVDYLQLLSSSEKQYNREREVATITRDLKLMALEFKIPIILLSQLNRNAEGNRPNMADLRESGAIEQDSDNVLFIHEPIQREINELINKGVYTTDYIEKMQKEFNKLSNIIIDKQRNGPVGTIDVMRVSKLMKFIEINQEV